MSSTAEKIESADDFLRGQQDCKDGALAPVFEPEDYYRGYRTQYELEQTMTARSERQ